LVISATALTCPVFSAISAMTAGSTSRLKLSEKDGAMKSGRPNQAASVTELKLIRSRVLTVPVPSGEVIWPAVTSSRTDSR
jgi:hypothetical protein